MAEELPDYLFIAQGGQSSISNGSDGMKITVHDIDPNATVSNGTVNKTSTLSKLSNLTYPLNAAMVFSGSANTSTSMVSVSNISLSDDNKLLTLQVTPLKFYEGTALKTYADTADELSSMRTKNVNETKMFLEFHGVVPTNIWCPLDREYCTMTGTCCSRDTFSIECEYPYIA